MISTKLDLDSIQSLAKGQTTDTPTQRTPEQQRVKDQKNAIEAAKQASKSTPRTPEQQKVKNQKDALAKEKQNGGGKDSQRTPEQQRAKDKKDRIIAEQNEGKAAQKALTPKQQAVKHIKDAKNAQKQTETKTQRTPEQQRVKDQKDVIAASKKKEEVKRTPEQQAAKEEKNRIMAENAAKREDRAKAEAAAKNAEKKALTPAQQAVKDQKNALAAEKKAESKQRTPEQQKVKDQKDAIAKQRQNQRKQNNVPEEEEKVPDNQTLDERRKSKADKYQKMLERQAMAEANGGEYRNPELTGNSNSAKTTKNSNVGKGKGAKNKGMVDTSGMNQEERKLAKQIAIQQRQRGMTPSNGWTQIDNDEVLRVQQAIQAESGSTDPPSAEQFENFFNSHGIDATGHVNNFAMPTLPGENQGGSMSSYMAGFAAVAVVMYYLKKRAGVDDEDSLFQRQKDNRSSLLDYLQNPFNKKRDHDDFDSI